jgi:hypothetical protein
MSDQIVGKPIEIVGRVLLKLHPHDPQILESIRIEYLHAKFSIKLKFLDNDKV